MKQYVYSFKEGNKDMRVILGGKGANLAEMTSIGLPVPQGFTVSTEACTAYYEDGKQISPEICAQIDNKLAELEAETGKKLGDPTNPLLVSVRSGARESMPGMMDTVLNLGLNDEVATGFTKITNNERFVYDSYRRFIQMFADVVMGFPKSSIERKFDDIKEEKGVEFDTDLTAEDLKEVVAIYKEEYKKHAGVEFPQDPKVQLMEAIKAVFRSWNNDRAITYRRLNDIPGSWGTAVNVQQMVYGNTGDTSGTGVAFTRNPATGEKKLFGEYLMNAQGEDVVAGIRTPQPIATLNDVMPECYEQFCKVCDILEEHYRDMQDMEFTIENGKLFMLQTRNGKRTAQAALKIAVDLVNEGMITKEQALLKVEPRQLDQLLHPMFDKDEYMYVNDVFDNTITYKGKPFNVMQYESRGNNYILCEKRDLAAFVDFEINKILTFGDPDYFQAHYKELMEPFKDRLNCMFTSDFYFEYTAKGVDKAKALDSVLIPMGYKKEEMMAFGDAQNDKSMVEYVGLGVAMGNASDELKAVANEITDTNNNDGIAKAIMKHIEL